MSGRWSPRAPVHGSPGPRRRWERSDAGQSPRRPSPLRCSMTSATTWTRGPAPRTTAAAPSGGTSRSTLTSSSTSLTLCTTSTCGWRTRPDPAPVGMSRPRVAPFTLSWWSPCCSPWPKQDPVKLLSPRSFAHSGQFVTRPGRWSRRRNPPLERQVDEHMESAQRHRMGTLSGRGFGAHRLDRDPRRRRFESEINDLRVSASRRRCVFQAVIGPQPPHWDAHGPSAGPPRSGTFPAKAAGGRTGRSPCVEGDGGGLPRRRH